VKKVKFIVFCILITISSLLYATSPKIHHLIFSGNDYFSSDKLLQLTGRTPNTIYDIDDLEPLIKDIINLYLSRGYLFITVSLQEISHTDGVYIATIAIDEGSVIRAENFHFTGNKVTKERILMRESRIQKDQIITQQVIDTAEKRISSKRYIIDSHIVPVNNNTLLINVKEGGMTHVSAIMGYASKQTQGQKLQGYINADFLNLMGTDRNFSVAWRSYHPKEMASLKYHESGPVNIPLFADFLLSREQYIETYVRTEIGTDLALDLYTQNLGLSLRLKDTYPQKESDVPKQNEKMIGLFYSGDFTDDIYNPTEGWELYFRQYLIHVNVGTQFTASNTAESVGTQFTASNTAESVGTQFTASNTAESVGTQFTASNTQESVGTQFTASNTQESVGTQFTASKFIRYRTEAKLANYQPIGDSFALANSISFSHLQNKHLTEYDLIHIGGTFTLRGFFEDMYAGNSIVYTNTEFRYLMSRYSRVFVFVDYGYVEDNRPDVQNKFTDLVGIGVGLRVNTPIGLFRMDYGFSYAEGEWSNPLDPLVHFGIETMF